MGFMKRFFGHQMKDDTTPSSTPSSTPATSNNATPIVSPAASIYDEEIKNNQVRYHNDPMRTSKKPDTIGNFLDPMGGHGSYSYGKDVTNTGA